MWWVLLIVTTCPQKQKNSRVQLVTCNDIMLQYSITREDVHMINNDSIRTWEEFKQLEIKEQVKTINELLAEGYSIPRISESLEGKNNKALDRTVIRKHFLRFGYRVENNEFILDETMEVNTPLTLKPKAQTNVQAVTKSYNAQFTSEEYEILQRLIREVRLRDQIVESVPETEKGESVNRNIRVYTQQYNEFADFCKNNHLKQADALYDAISDFMTKYK